MRLKYSQRNQMKYTKKLYRVRNLREYKAGLCKRGKLTIRFPEVALRDSTPVPDLLAPITRGLASVRADGAYDRASVYCAIENHKSDAPTSTRILIPPGRNAKISNESGVDSAQRDANIQQISRVGRRCWQKESGYTRRNLVETAVSRVKNQFGRALRSRSMPAQKTEVRIACSILNTMTKLGMPDGYCVS